MPFASSSEVRVAYVPEATFGVTPATPSWKTLRVTGGGLRTNKTTVTSDERQADRNVRDEILTGVAASGSYNYEFTADTFDDLLAAAMCGAWATNVLKNGVIDQSFTIEETLELGATDSFSRFLGARVNTMSLSVGARERITGSMALMAQREALATAIIIGSTYAAPNTNAIATASANVAALTIAGIATPPIVRSLSFELSNGLRERPSVGTLYTAEFGKDRFNVTGTMNCYFQTNELYQAVLDHGTAALSFQAGVEANKKYGFLFPKIRFGDGERAVGGNADDVMVNIPFRALFDPVEACSLKITRALA